MDLCHESDASEKVAPHLGVARVGADQAIDVRIQLHCIELISSGMNAIVNSHHMFGCLLKF